MSNPTDNNVLNDQSKVIINFAVRQSAATYPCAI